MKKFTSLIVLCNLCISSAFAQFVGPSSQLPVSTVSQVLKEAGKLDSRDTVVSLKGHIISYLHGDYYYFKDVTGTILIELEPEDMPRQPFDQNTLVTLYAEVEAEWFEKTKLDVSRVVIMGPANANQPPLPRPSGFQGKVNQ